MNKTLVVLAGPSAVGKTTCGIDIANHFGTEIISADSRQIYRETTIGTAVPSLSELSKAHHHFIQTLSVTEPYNASKFEDQVLDQLKILFKKYNVVLMVGGSGLYIDAVCQGIDALPSVDPDLRSSLLRRFEKEGLGPLTDELLKIDPVSHNRVDLNNHMRVMKALEVSIQTGKPYSSFLSGSRKERPFRILRIALDMEREMLYNRINMRVEKMIKSGLLREVEQLQHLREFTAMKTVGYREIFSYLDGDIQLEEAIDLIKRNTRKFARKQLTWFRKDDCYQWFSPVETNQIILWLEDNLPSA